MKLVKDNNPGAYAVAVSCVHPSHEGNTRRFTLADGYSDLDGKAFVDYYCDSCVKNFELLRYVYQKEEV